MRFGAFLLTASALFVAACADATCSDQSLCPATYEPICAKNGGSYMNQCQFAAAQCKNASQVVKAHQGECVRSPPRKKPLVVLVGDSITQMGFDPNYKGWGIRLAYDYLRQIDVLNRGYGGFTTKWFLEFAMPELLADMKKYQPTLITLWLGTNDGSPGGPMQVTVDQYRFNLKLLVHKLQQAAPQAKVLLIAPPPVKDEGHSASIKLHSDVVVEVAKSLKLNVLNLYDYFMTKFPDATARNNLLIDGIHFTLDGNQELYNAIRGKIVEILPANMLADWQTPSYVDVMSYA